VGLAGGSWAAWGLQSSRSELATQRAATLPIGKWSNAIPPPTFAPLWNSCAGPSPIPTRGGAVLSGGSRAHQISIRWCGPSTRSCAMRQRNPVQPGLQSGVSSHPRPYVRVRDGAELFPHLDGEWPIGLDIPAFHEPTTDDTRHTTTQSAISEREQEPETLPVNRRHVKTVRTWHKVVAVHELSHGATRDRPRDAFCVPEDDRLDIDASRDRDRAGCERECASPISRRPGGTEPFRLMHPPLPSGRNPETWQGSRPVPFGVNEISASCINHS